jgi:hypothetical protein
MLMIMMRSVFGLAKGWVFLLTRMTPIIGNLIYVTTKIKDTMVFLRVTGGLAAYRPPLLPVLVAASHQVFGRQFWPIRFLNSVFCSTHVLACVFPFIA